MHFSSALFSDVSTGGGLGMGGRALSDDEECNGIPLILRNKAPRWHEQLQCWCLNFRGRVTIASVKNFQLVAGTHTAIWKGRKGHAYHGLPLPTVSLPGLRYLPEQFRHQVGL